MSSQQIVLLWMHLDGKRQLKSSLTHFLFIKKKKKKKRVEISPNKTYTE